MNVYVILTVLAWGVWGFAQKSALLKMNMVMVQLSSFISVLATMPIYFYIMRDRIRLPEFNVPGVLWSSCAGISVIIAGCLYLQALKTMNVSTLSIVTASYPAVTMILAVLFLGEPLTFIRTISIPIILFGMWLAGQS